MGTNNRARRAAKQGKRRGARSGRQDGSRTPRPAAEPHSEAGPPSRETVEDALGHATYAARANPQAAQRQVDELCAVDRRFPTLIDQVVVPWLERMIRLSWEGGWQPLDLAEYGRRKLDVPLSRALPDAIALEHRRYSAAELDARWRGQLTEIGAGPWWATGQPLGSQWADRWGASRRAALVSVIELGAFLATLPRLERLLPMPGEHVAIREPVALADEADSKVLGRVRALLAKAESTEYPEEAEALSGKAQEMMTKYSLDRALVDAKSGDAVSDGPIARRVWIEAPYVAAKNSLVHAVATANGCSTVSFDKLGFITVLGFAADVELVEMLSTSLLVQASRAMLRTKAQSSPTGRSRTRSFRHAFLLSYAGRIGERLREASEATRADVADADRDLLLPVLAKRDDQVQTLFAELFPHTRTRKTNVTNYAGWAAGRAAADQASLNARSEIA